MAVPSLGGDVLASATAFGAVGEGITEEYLRHHCGVDDLDDVVKLTISVNRDEQPVEMLGKSCPYLQELKLSDSFVQSIRDLGTGLQNLRVLWLSRSGLTELWGISALPQLDELYVSFNEISDLSSLNYHDRLQVLDLEGNNVADWDEVEALETLPELRELNLDGNPIKKATGYAKRVCSLLPNLEMLDDEMVATMDLGEDSAEDIKEVKDGSEARSAEASTEVGTGTDHFIDEPDEDTLLLEGIKKHNGILFGQSSTARPATSAGARPWIGPSSAPPSVRPSTSFVAPVAWGVEDDSSELTLGCEKGVAGNPLHLARLRRKAAPRAEDESLDIRSLLDRFRTFTQPSCLSDAELAARQLDAENRPRTGQVSVRISRGRPSTAAALAALADDEPREKAPAPTLRGSAEVFTLEDM
jgi:hypothetical protein